MKTAHISKIVASAAAALALVSVLATGAKPAHAQFGYGPMPGQVFLLTVPTPYGPQPEPFRYLGGSQLGPVVEAPNGEVIVLAPQGPIGPVLNGPYGPFVPGPYGPVALGGVPFMPSPAPMMPGMAPRPVQLPAPVAPPSAPVVQPAPANPGGGGTSTLGQIGGLILQNLPAIIEGIGSLL